MRISVFDRFDSVYNDWEKLIENSQSSPFISAFWQNLWWENFGEGNLYITKIFDDQEVIGIVPLYLNGNIVFFKECGTPIVFKPFRRCLFKFFLF